MKCVGASKPPSVADTIATTGAVIDSAPISTVTDWPMDTVGVPASTTAMPPDARSARDPSATSRSYTSTNTSASMPPMVAGLASTAPSA